MNHFQMQQLPYWTCHVNVHLPFRHEVLSKLIEWPTTPLISVPYSTPYRRLITAAGVNHSPTIRNVRLEPRVTPSQG